MRIDFERTLEEFKGVCEKGDAESVGISVRGLIFRISCMESCYSCLISLEEFGRVIGGIYDNLKRFSGDQINGQRNNLRRYLRNLAGKSSRAKYFRSVPEHVREGLGLRGAA